MQHSVPPPRLDRGSARSLTQLRLVCVPVIVLLCVAGVLWLRLPMAAVWVSLAWLAHGVVAHRIVQPIHDPERLERAMAWTLPFDALALAGLVAATGGVWWCGAVLYGIFTVGFAAVLSPRRTWQVGAATAVSLSAVLTLQVMGVLPESHFLGVQSMRGAWQSAIVGVVVIIAELAGLAWVQHLLTGVLRDRAARYRALMDTASDLFVVLAHDGAVTHVNRATLALAQCSRRELLRDGMARLLVPEDVQFFRTRLTRALAGDQQVMMVRAHGFHGIRWLSCTLAPMVPGLRTSSLLAIFRDVTDDRLATDSVRHSEARLRAVFNQAAIAIALLDLDGCFAEVNPAVERLLGYDSVGLVGRRWNAFAPPEDHEETTRVIEALRAGERESLCSEQRFVRQDGRVLWTQMTLSRVDNPTGAAGLIAMLQDVTERRALEAQLTWQAFHDPLTNLANRALFRERVERRLAERTGTSGTVAVLFLDLDNFKTINDSMGHAAGDQLLFEVGRRLLNATRGCDTVARLGGDEFAILLDNVRVANDCVRVAERVLESMQAPVHLEDAEVIVSTSVGIVRDAGDESADDILRNADVAMYNAKQRGKGRYSLFEPGMHDKAVERLRLQNDLRTAVEHDEITLQYQPIVTLADGTPVGFEALARWQHPEFGLVSPATFVPLAEETGMIVPLGTTILRLACAHASTWNALPGLTQRIGVSVNLSARQLEEPGVVADVRAALTGTGLAPECLTLEITESALVHDSGTVRERLLELKAIGVSLAIDDFGTGYSSLSYIQQFPADVLKIDRSFVEGLGRQSGTDAALARTIIALGASLQLRTVAEGIEGEAQRAILRELGCELGQGYLYARPMSAADVLPWLATALGLPAPALPVHAAPLHSSRPPGRRPRSTGEMAAVAGA